MNTTFFPGKVVKGHFCRPHQGSTKHKGKNSAGFFCKAHLHKNSFIFFAYGTYEELQNVCSCVYNSSPVLFKPHPLPFFQAADITDIYTYHNTTKNLGSFCRGPKTEKNKIE